MYITRMDYQYASGKATFSLQDLPLMCIFVFVLFPHLPSFPQTTIIWDAHTGEAKQQFPFHSGNWLHIYSFKLLKNLCLNQKQNSIQFIKITVENRNINLFVWLFFILLSPQAGWGWVTRLVQSGDRNKLS